MMRKNRPSRFTVAPYSLIRLWRRSLGLSSFSCHGMHDICQVLQFHVRHFLSTLKYHCWQFSGSVSNRMNSTRGRIDNVTAKSKIGLTVFTTSRFDVHDFRSSTCLNGVCSLRYIMIAINLNSNLSGQPGVCLNVVAQRHKPELCADELVVGGGVGWSYDRRRRRAAHFSSAAVAWLYCRRRRRQTG